MLESQGARIIGSIAQGGQSATDGERNPEKGERFLCESNGVKYDLIGEQSGSYPIPVLRRVMGVSRSTFYEWEHAERRLSTSRLGVCAAG